MEFVDFVSGNGIAGFAVRGVFHVSSLIWALFAVVNVNKNQTDPPNYYTDYTDHKRPIVPDPASECRL
jgi:hypothetical protein